MVCFCLNLDLGGFVSCINSSSEIFIMFLIKFWHVFQCRFRSKLVTFLIEVVTLDIQIIISAVEGSIQILQTITWKNLKSIYLERKNILLFIIFCRLLNIWTWRFKFICYFNFPCLCFLSAKIHMRLNLHLSVYYCNYVWKRLLTSWL